MWDDKNFLILWKSYVIYLIIKLTELYCSISFVVWEFF